MSFILWYLKLYAVLKVRPPQHRTEKGNPFLHPLVTLCMINPRILLAARAHYWLQLAFNQNPQIPFHEAALQPLIPQAISISKVSPSQVQNLALILVEFYIVDDCPAVRFVKTSLQDLSTLESQQLLLILYCLQICLLYLRVLHLSHLWKHSGKLALKYALVWLCWGSVHFPKAMNFLDQEDPTEHRQEKRYSLYMGQRVLVGQCYWLYLDYIWFSCLYDRMLPNFAGTKWNLPIWVKITVILCARYSTQSYITFRDKLLNTLSFLLLHITAVNKKPTAK